MHEMCRQTVMQIIICSYKLHIQTCMYLAYPLQSRKLWPTHICSNIPTSGPLPNQLFGNSVVSCREPEQQVQPAGCIVIISRQAGRLCYKVGRQAGRQAGR